MQKSSPSDLAPRPIKENPFWLNFEARARQIGLFLLLIVIAAAISGVFSKGYFSHIERSNSRNGLTLSYERFGRQTSDMAMKISLPVTTGQEVTVTLGGDFMDTFQIDTLQPQPDKMSARGNALVLTYSHTASAPLTLWLNLVPLETGTRHSRVSVNDGDPLSFWQFIYP